MDTQQTSGTNLPPPSSTQTCGCGRDWTHKGRCAYRRANAGPKPKAKSDSRRAIAPKPEAKTNGAAPSADPIRAAIELLRGRRSELDEMISSLEKYLL